jgi:manganese transport protein
MYKHILVAIEHSPADRTIVRHVCQLAKLTQADLVLVHVADGFAARHFDDLKLRESEEMRDDREYLEMLCAELRSAGLTARSILAMGDPATEIMKAAEREHADLIAMSTHGHRFLNDLVRGATADRVRHGVAVPVLLLRAEK